MWMMVWRPLVVLAGMFGGSVAAATAAISLNPVASSTLAGLVLAVMAVQAAISLALIVYGVWTPLARRLTGGR